MSPTPLKRGTRILFQTPLLAVFVMGLINSSETTSADDLPKGVIDTQDPSDISLTPAESLSRITVPEGFSVTLFAGEPDVRRPIAFDFDDRGRLWVVENYSHPVWKENNRTDRILIFEDIDQDGRFDIRKVFWDEGRYVTGIAVGHGGVWIANTPGLEFIADADRDDRPDAEPVVIVDGFRKSTNNVVNNLHWGPDGWLYGAIGLSPNSFVGRPGTPEAERTRISRGIWRCHPETHRFEKVAEGMVNPWGADFNEFGDLITSNTVIAHLWHIVPGMYCQRRGREQDNPYAYDRIQSITDHLHWGGGAWQSSRTSEHKHSVAGGGHAHCGGMIYLGGNWPEQYHGTFFTNNLHGNRVNNDRLIPRGSSYVGVHAEDFLFGNDPWFRGMSIKYGADGGVYVSDWHDIGECHDSDGSHRSSGRIFKVVYGEPKPGPVDLQRESTKELAELHRDTNEWVVRHARRLLHERAIAGDDLSTAVPILRQQMEDGDNVKQQLRALWTLFVVSELDEPQLTQLLDSPQPHIRRWAVRLLVDQRKPSATTINRMARMARDETSPKVRLALAVALQRIQLDDRIEIARGLISHGEDASDGYLPLMIWWGVEPLVDADRDSAYELAFASNIPLIRQYIARRIVDREQPPLDELISRTLNEARADRTGDVAIGMLEALDARGSFDEPAKWRQLAMAASQNSSPEVRSSVLRLATIFGDQKAIANQRQIVLDAQEAPDARRTALANLLSLNDSANVTLLHRILTEAPLLRPDALQALTVQNNEETATAVLKVFDELEDEQKTEAVAVLAGRSDSAVQLLDSIAAGTIQKNEVSAYTLHQLRNFKSDIIRQKIGEIWSANGNQIARSEEIARMKNVMTQEYLEAGHAEKGRIIFRRMCVKCHMLFDEGGTIGPNLTGSGRKKLDYALSNLIDPSGEIDPAYRLTTVLTDDGRALSGFMVKHTEQFVLLRTQEATVRLDMKNIDEIATSDVSMMPEGILRQLENDEIRDLLVYLASEEQVPLLEPDHGETHD